LIELIVDCTLAYAKETLRARDELLAMARSVHRGEVPPLRLGSSSFVKSNLLEIFQKTYCGMFPWTHFVKTNLGAKTDATPLSSYRRHI